MKKIHLTLLAVAVLAAGCGDKSPEEMVVGTWDCQMEYKMGPTPVIETQQTTYNDNGTFEGAALMNVDSPEGKISVAYNVLGTWSLAEKSFTQTITGGEVISSKPANHPFAAMTELGLTKAVPVISEIITLTEDELTAKYNIPGLPQELKSTCTR